MANKQLFERLQGYIKQLKQDYPTVWKEVDHLREQRGISMPQWPDWCFLPLSACSYIISNNCRPEDITLETTGDISRIGALAAWRITQGVYRFDDTLYQEVQKTEIDNKIPVEILYRLPEWCIYMETPSMSFVGKELVGVFVHLEWDMNKGTHELRLLLDYKKDTEHNLTPIVIHLSNTETLLEGIDKATQEAKYHAQNHNVDHLGINLNHNYQQTIAHDLKPILALLLYICSKNAEIGQDNNIRIVPQLKKTKKGSRLFPPKKPQVWPVGIRIGAELRRNSVNNSSNQKNHDTQNTVRPHIRRAHWHTYHIGKGRQRTTIKWVPPTAVNVSDTNELATTVRHVKK